MQRRQWPLLSSIKWQMRRTSISRLTSSKSPPLLSSLSGCDGARWLYLRIHYWSDLSSRTRNENNRSGSSTAVDAFVPRNDGHEIHRGAATLYRHILREICWNWPKYFSWRINYIFCRSIQNFYNFISASIHVFKKRATISRVRSKI